MFAQCTVALASAPWVLLAPPTQQAMWSSTGVPQTVARRVLRWVLPAVAAAPRQPPHPPACPMYSACCAPLAWVFPLGIQQRRPRIDNTGTVPMSTISLVQTGRQETQGQSCHLLSYLCGHISIAQQTQASGSPPCGVLFAGRCCETPGHPHPPGWPSPPTR